MSRFRSLEAMLASGHDRVVELRFTNVEGASLHAHSCVLSNWSRVLAHVIEDAHSTQPDAAAAEAAAGPARHQTIPLDDADCSAWEDALSLMYPAVPLLQVTWGNAARLLLLADKYDMPAVTEHVRIFLDTPREAFASTAAAAAAGAAAGAAAAAGPLRLEAQLTGASSPGLPNVFEWLPVTSKCGLEQHAQTCIDHIIKQQLPIPAGLISSIQPQHAEALFNAMQQALQQAQAQLQQAALPSQDFRCACCRNRWYLLPGAGRPQLVPGAAGTGNAQGPRQAAACMHCGEDVTQRHQGDLEEEEPHIVFSQSLGTTNEAGGEDDTDDDDEEDEGGGSGSDEAMSQDSNSQGADGATDDDDDLDGSDDDSMLSGSEESDEGDGDSDTGGATDEEAG
ncbi:hypothetical protein OEZ86_010911 [Tetradesmus obliquus]|nr:hypothetical protein OEZ86_010911 [Tetradesmus obliquus]